MRSLVCSLALALAALSPAYAAGAPHPFTARDLHEMRRISEPATSPDGRRVAFTLRTTDFEADRGRNDLWIAGTDGAGVKRLTTDPASDTSPRFSPDGEDVFFLSARSGSTQVWRIPVDGGEARPVTSLALEVGGFLLSPDGRTLLVSLEVFPQCASIDCTVTRLDEAAKRKSSGRIYDRALFRHWDTWSDHRRSHLVAVPVAGGAALDLMRGMDADVPSKPFGDMSDVAFTPDGKGVVFSTKDVGREEAWSTDFDLYVVPLDGSAAPRCLTEDNPAWDAGPTFSPDGRTLAYKAMARPGFEADRFRIVLRPWPDGPSRVLTEAWDRSVDAMTWAPDGKSIWATADDLGNEELFAIDVATGKARRLTESGHHRDPRVAGKRVLFGMDTMTAPVDLYTLDPATGDTRRVTDVNRDLLASIVMGGTEQFTFEGWNGDTVYGWTVKPAGFDPSKKYPVAFLIHGGPQGSWSNDFHYRWNPQAYAGAGYAVVMIDFHGSTGYGQAFTDAISNHWGDRPLEDLRKGLAAALAKYPWMRGDDVAALGASYGGYMIYWIEGAWPDRFRCLVSHDGVFDTRAGYYDTEELWFPEWEHGGTPWDRPEAFEEFNPATKVGNWKTPMLVIHGERDYRVTLNHGLSAFNALQRRGVPSRLLVFPDENHFVLRPSNALLWHQTVLEWLGRWTAK